MAIANLYCRKCGGANVPGPSTCSGCGRPLAGASTTPLPQVKCRGCGAMNVDGRAICQNCDKDLRDAERPTPNIAATAAAPITGRDLQRVVVTDIEMPFGSMVTFMLKWFFASIPVLFMVGVFIFVMGAVFTGCLAALGSASTR